MYICIRMACEDCKEDLDNICRKAAEKGHLQCLIWAHKNEYSWDEDTCACAAQNGHLDCLIWARHNGCSASHATEGCPWNEDTCGYAATKSLKCLMWARKNGCPWDEGTCAWAADKGHLDCLMWARRNGCPWDWRICTYATISRHLEILIWARKNGCPWDKRACTWATQNGKKDIHKWIHTNGSLCNCIDKVLYEIWNGWIEGEECNICLEKLDESTVKFRKCVHRYHKECMDTMLEMRKEVKKKGCSICARGK